MNDTAAQERKSPDVSPRGRLLRTLASMSRRFPRTFLQTTADGFGVQLADGAFLRIVYSGRWTDGDLRDFLALFATWLVADPQRLRNGGIPLDGLLLRDRAESLQSNGRAD
jgi:hypothetical protein